MLAHGGLSRLTEGELRSVSMPAMHITTGLAIAVLLLAAPCAHAAGSRPQAPSGARALPQRSATANPVGAVPYGVPDLAHLGPPLPSYYGFTNPVTPYVPPSMQPDSSASRAGVNPR